MKDRACFTVRAEGRELTLCYIVRELKFLGGPPLPAGHRLVRALGVFDNFTVAKGQDTHAWTSRDRQELLAVAYDLFQSISVAQTLFEYDYQYNFSLEAKIRNTG